MTEAEALARAAAETVSMKMEPDDIRVNPELNKLVKDALFPVIQRDQEMMRHPDFNPLTHGHPVQWQDRYKSIRKQVIAQYMAEQQRNAALEHKEDK